MDGVCVNGVTVWSFSKLLLLSDRSVTFGPVGGVPVAVAWFVTLPLLMFACVIVYVAVKVELSLAPGARLAIGPPDTVANGSVIVTFVSVTFPVFVTVKA